MRITNFISKETNREIDSNGYLLVSDCLLLHDGVTINPRKIYKLNISLNELEKTKETFKLISIVIK